MAQTQYLTDTNTFTPTTPITHSELQRIARSLKRADLSRRYSHGTIKRSAMAMINYYMRQAGTQFATHPHDLHAVM